MTHAAHFLPRDCLTSGQVRRLFGRPDANGTIQPISRVTLKRWRHKGSIPFIQMNCRVFLYPREGVERVIAAANSTLKN